MATNDKYDRQIRLWGSHGQYLLNQSRVLVIGATGAGSETLKNLVLPRIKYFGIIDDGLIRSRDVGRDFFLEDEKVG